MKRHSKNHSNPEERLESSELTNALVSKLDGITARQDVVINILLGILLSDTNYESVSYTDKAVYLQSLGLQIEDISKIVGRPSNWVSSRLRESKTRKSSKRQRKIGRKPSPEEALDQTVS